MKKLTRSDLLTLEDYAEKRSQFRTRVMEHKRARRVNLGDHICLMFEDRLTMQYQVQEMLRAERVFDARGIEEEIGAYNPLIPDGSNWKATVMIQYGDVEERKRALAKLIGVEDALWLRVGDADKVRPICDEDLERSTEEKTSAVHFVRFELDSQMIDDAKSGAPIAMGVDHPNYRAEVNPLPGEIAAALIADLD